MSFHYKVLTEEQVKTKVEQLITWKVKYIEYIDDGMFIVIWED